MPIGLNVHTRARDESGFGLLELLMAMVMLNVGILAIVAAFSSGNAALARAIRRLASKGARLVPIETGASHAGGA